MSGLSDEDRERFRALGEEAAKWTPEQIDELARIAESAPRKTGDDPHASPPRSA